MSGSLKENESAIINHIFQSGKRIFHLGKGKFCIPKRKPWWNAECSRWVALKRKAYNKFKRRPTRLLQLEYRRLEAKVKRVVLKAKRKSWRKFLSKLNLQISCTEVWRFLRSFMGKPTNNNYPLTQNGTTLIDAFAKAEFLAEQFDQIMGERLLIFNEDVKLAYIKGALEEATQDPTNAPFSLHELNEQIAKLKTNKSPGTDMIVNEFLIHLPEHIRIILLTIFNESWVTKESLTSGKLKRDTSSVETK